MAFFRRLRSLVPGSGAGARGANALFFYVRCDRCGEVIQVRADRRWDLLQELDEEVAGYSLHKDVLGTRCNTLMRMLVLFDGTYKIIRQDVESGRFVSQADYETYRSTSQ